MIQKLWRGLTAVVIGAVIVSCGDSITGPDNQSPQLRTDILQPNGIPAVLISQVYGGGGNTSLPVAPLKNDFIELFNPGTDTVNVAGWSVQYASSTGASWQVTPITGKIAPGAYYLVQEAAGTGAVPALPTPDATGTIAMAGGAGKVALVPGTAALSGACPTAGSFVNSVSYGSTATDCGVGVTPTLANNTVALRNNDGCTYTGSTSADFSVAAPAPRNSASPKKTCPTVFPPVTSVTISPDSAVIQISTNQTFAAVGRDASNNITSTTFKWSSDNVSVATVDSLTGVATAVGIGSATITARSANGITDTSILRVIPAPLYDVVISQIYGGGGNSQAQYTNDYVELFNRGSEPATITGWTVQYASNTSSSWSSVTLPAGTIAPGKYYLVQLAAGTGTPGPLPTPDAVGALSLGAGGGKIILTLPGAAPLVACPTGASIVDRVAYGTGTNCAGPSDWGSSTAATSNTTAAFRKNDGCIKTGSTSADFIVLAPNPHNSASPTKNCTNPTREQSTATIVINEVMGDPANAESASWGEWFEVHNYGATPVNLKNWVIVTNGTSQPDHTISSDLIVPAGGFAVLGRGNDFARNGGVTLDYNYFTGSATTIWLDDSDYLMLVDNANARVDSVAWTSMTHGVSRGLRDPSVAHADIGNSATWGFSSAIFGDGDYGTPGADNGTLVNVAPTVSANKITITGRIATDAPIPAGFEAQIFASEATAGGVAIPTTFTFESLTPSFASIDERGVIHGISEGSARFKITAADGTARIHTLQISTPVASATAVYLDNAAFGEPVDGDASNDFIIHRPQYTTSFNGALGTPNWVAYEINKTAIVPGQDRCNCFTFDPELIAAGFTRYTTADYTGAGGFAGYGIDRGHMTRSFDRTAGTLDNARTFYFSNVVPQAADLNQGPWANMENYLGGLAQNSDKEVYIYVGPAGSIGTVKNEGKINIPKYTWKVALVLPLGKGLADVHDYRDVEEVVAVVMPNIPGIRDADWTSYKVTVDSVEALTGYDFLNLLPQRTQRALESGTKPPLAAVDGPYTLAEGSSVSLSAAGSIDPNGTVNSYAWDFGDGSTGTGSSVSHTYTQDGSYSVTLVVTDNDGLVDSVATTATVSNVAPVVGTFAGATIIRGETYTSSGTFTDPGADTWTATANYGDGSGPSSLSLTGNAFSLSHAYATAGTFTVTVTVNDDDTSGAGSQTVSVLSAGEGVDSLTTDVKEMIEEGILSGASGGSLVSKLDAALKQINLANGQAAAGQLRAFINEVNALVRSGRLTAADASELTAFTARLITSLGS